MHAKQWRIGLIGYGEVGTILAEDLRKQGITVNAYDLKLGSAAGKEIERHAAAFNVGLMHDHAALAAASDLVLSAVTASQAVGVAQACAPGMRSAAFFLDFNSASPNAKRRAGELIDAAGARYVEGAVMTSIPPYRLRVPLLLGGPFAAGLCEPLNQLGFISKVASPQTGTASAIKMCRSVMIKGMEAMVIESLTAARAYGVEDEVIASLHETFPGIEWEKQAAYFFQRVIEHGRRRAEELREVANTVRDIGLEPHSAAGSALRQDWIADLAQEDVFGRRGGDGFARSGNWRTEADRILSRTGETGRTLGPHSPD